MRWGAERQMAERHEKMAKILKKLIAVACYFFLMAFFFEFQIVKLFDWKQLLIWLLGTGLLLAPSLGEKAQGETGGERWERIARCSLWAGFLESFLLCIGALEQADNVEKLLPELALCLRPVLYGVCARTVFAEEQKTETLSGEEREKDGFREITASESYVLFERMGLTKRECEIAILVCRGMSNGEIAESLCISEATVKKHISNIFEKLECTRREQIRTRLFSEEQKG